MSNNIQRIVYLDLLRLVAAFGVVVIHVFCTDYPSSFESSDWHDWYIALVGESLARWAVPVFVMISGTLFLNPKKDVTIRDMVTKKVPHLLLAYVFWVMAYGIIVTGYKTIYKGEAFSMDYLFSPHFHLWFLPMLMGVYMLVPLLRKIAKEKHLLKYALYIWAAYITVSFANPDIPYLQQVTNLFGANIIVGYVGYFLLGYHLSQTSFSKKQRWIIYILGLAGAAITIFGNIVISFSNNEPSQRFWDTLSPQVAAMATALFVMFKEVTPKPESRLFRFVEYVRKDLFGIYLTHAIWLLLLDHSAVRDLCNQAITLPLITIAVFVLSLYTTKLIRLIPGLRKVVE